MRIRKFFMLPDDGGAGGGFTGGTAGAGAPSATTGAEGGATGVGANGGANPVGAGTNPASTGVGGVAQPASIEYQPFNVPESFGGIDNDTFTAITAVGKESNMTQAQLQKLIDIGAKKMGDGMESVRLEIQKKYSDWAEKSKNDPEIKPHLDDKGQLPKVGEMINRTMGEDTKEFHKMAEETGIATNPLFIKFCLRMSKLMGEASFVGGSIGGEQKLSMLEQAKTMFPNM